MISFKKFNFETYDIYFFSNLEQFDSNQYGYTHVHTYTQNLPKKFLSPLHVTIFTFHKIKINKEIKNHL